MRVRNFYFIKETFMQEDFSVQSLENVKQRQLLQKKKSGELYQQQVN